MVGMAVFTVWTPVTQLITGTWVLIALAIACVVAAANATSTARLAARLPHSGGVYSYAKHWLNIPSALIAGYSFWISKTASSATAALAIGAYLTPQQPKITALVAIAVALGINAAGINRTVIFLAVTSATVIAILLFTTRHQIEAKAFEIVSNPSVVEVLGAAAYLFIAFAGYARIATLGAEVKDPRKTIPVAMTASLIVVAALMAFIGWSVSSRPITGDASLLALNPDARFALQIAVVLSAGGTLISLIAGMSRTVLAMASNQHAPATLRTLHNGIPQRAQSVVAVGIATVALAGGIRFGLALAATAILTYYAIAHLSALKAGLGKVVPLAGLLGCFGLGLSLLWVNF